MGAANSRQEAFWEACGFGSEIKVRKLLQEGVNVNRVSFTHNSCPIHVASQGKPEIVKLLIEADCDVNVLDDRGNLALHHAAMKGHADIIQMLIDAGSHINKQNQNDWTALINAAYWCHPDAIKVLIKNNCDVKLHNKDERTALHEACRSQSSDEAGLESIARMLIEAGSDINAESTDMSFVIRGEKTIFTPLMLAAYHGHTGIARALIDAKCDLEAHGANKWTALHWASDRGRIDAVRLLLESGLSPLAQGRRGELPVDRAQDNEIKEILRQATNKAKKEQELEEEDKDSAHKLPTDTTENLNVETTEKCFEGMTRDKINSSGDTSAGNEAEKSESSSDCIIEKKQDCDNKQDEGGQSTWNQNSEVENKAAVMGSNVTESRDSPLCEKDFRTVSTDATDKIKDKVVEEIKTSGRKEDKNVEEEQKYNVHEDDELLDESAFNEDDYTDDLKDMAN